MNFIQSIKTCFRKYFVFKGRAMRSEFWWFQLFGLVFTCGAMTVDHLFLGYSFDDVATPVAMAAMLAILIPSASVAARRLHDIGWPGWVQLPVFLTYSAYLEIWFPGFGETTLGVILMSVGTLFWVALLLILIKDSQPQANKYGPNPKSPNMGEVFN